MTAPFTDFESLFGCSPRVDETTTVTDVLHEPGCAVLHVGEGRVAEWLPLLVGAMDLGRPIVVAFERRRDFVEFLHRSGLSHRRGLA
jgi:hypothetical protein